MTWIHFDEKFLEGIASLPFVRKVCARPGRLQRFPFRCNACRNRRCLRRGQAFIRAKHIGAHHERLHHPKEARDVQVMPVVAREIRGQTRDDGRAKSQAQGFEERLLRVAVETSAFGNALEKNREKDEQADNAKFGHHLDVAVVQIIAMLFGDAVRKAEIGRGVIAEA